MDLGRPDMVQRILAGQIWADLGRARRASVNRPPSSLSPSQSPSSATRRCSSAALGQRRPSRHSSPREIEEKPGLLHQTWPQGAGRHRMAMKWSRSPSPSPLKELCRQARPTQERLCAEQLPRLRRCPASSGLDVAAAVLLCCSTGRRTAEQLC